MKKTIIFILCVLLLLPCIVSFATSADTQSTTVRYSVSPTVIYMDYDGTRTIQKVETGSTLKEPAHKGMSGYTFLGWKNLATGVYWDFRDTVEDNLELVACYKEEGAQEDSEIQMGEGTFSLDVKAENGVPKVTVTGTDKVKLMELMLQNDSITEEELEDIAEGASMDMVLVIKNGETTISEAVKAAMQNSAEGYTIGQYLDISLFKQLTEDGKVLDNEQMHELPEKVTITIRLPDSLRNTDPNIQRTYCVLRNHEGKTEVLASVYHEATYTLTFQTDRFSEYAIAYRDEKKATGGKGSGTEPATEKATEKVTERPTEKTTERSIEKPTEAPAKDTVSVKAASTGDTTDWMPYIWLLLLSIIAIGATIRSTFRRSSKS